MKTKIANKITLAVWMALAGALFFSCSDDDSSAPTSIRLSTATLSFNRLGLTTTGELPSITVASNKYWTIRTAEQYDWLTASPMAGADNTEITFTAKENLMDTERTATLILESMDGTSAQLLVVQNGYTETIYYQLENMGYEEVSEMNTLVYDGWQKEGIGARLTRYTGNDVKIDNNNPSSGYEGASGGNNILFAADGADFSWGRVDTRGFRYFWLRFGIMSTGSFDPSVFTLYISNDNALWIPLPYTRDDDAGWSQAELKFRVTDTPELYFKLVSTADEIYRLDDIMLTEDKTMSGEEVVFKEVTAEVTVLEEDFSWLNYGDAIPYVTTGEKRYDAWTQEEKDRGWTSSVVIGTEQLCYARVGFIKLGKTNYAGDLISPKLSALTKPTDVKVTFKAAGYISAGNGTSSNGTKDDNLLKVVVLNAGTTGQDLFVINNFPNDKKADNEGVVNDIWADDRAYSFTITGATSDTQIQFIGGEQFDLAGVGQGKNRIFMDDIKVVTIP